MPRTELTFTQRMLLWGLVILTVARWVIGAHLDITPAEALLVEWGRHPGLAGMDGGWGTAFLTLPGSWLFGRTPLGVRWLSPLMAVLASWLLHRLVRSATGDKQAAWAVTILNLTPAFNHAAVFLRPELPAALFQLAGMAALWRALRRASGWDLHWPLAGLCFGAASFFWPGALWATASTIVLLAAARRWRRHLLRPGFWLLLADAALFLWPVWQWNRSHAMAGFDHWQEGLHPAPGIAWLQPFLLGGKWALAVGPLIFGAAIWALAAGLRRWSASDPARFFTAFALTPLAGGLLIALGGGGGTAWIAAALPGVCGLLPWAWEDRLADRLAWKQRVQWLTVLPSLVLTPIALEPDLLRHAGLDIPPGRDASRAWRGWRPLAAEVTRIVEAAAPQAEPDPRGARRLLLIARDERLASVLNFHLSWRLPIRWPTTAHPLVHTVESPVPDSPYHFWPRYDAIAAGRSHFVGATALYITDDESRRDPPDRIARAFTSWRPLAVFDVRHLGQRLRRIRVFACYDYTGLPE